TIYLYVSLSNGDGSFSGPYGSAWNFSTPNGDLSKYTIKFADLNGDGRMDIFLGLGSNSSSWGTNVFAYATLLSNGNGTFGTNSNYYTFGTSLPAGCPNVSTYSFEIGDYDGNGRSDVRVFCSDGPGPSPTSVYSNAYSYSFLSLGNGLFGNPVYWTSQILFN